MVLSVKGKGAPLADYGILIPVAPGRVSRILEVLRAHPVLGPRESEWHLVEGLEPVTRSDLERAHDAEYVDALYSDRLEGIVLDVYELIGPDGKPHRYDPAGAVRPLTELFENSRRNAAGTHRCCEIALERGFCFYFGGGGHHAHPGFGHGFCLVNDLVVGLRKLQAEGRIRSAWIIDVDAHKGDGSAAITREDPSIVTLSVHMASGWPLDSPEFGPDGSLNPSHIPSDIDVPIESGEEDRYVPELAAALDRLDRYPRPDLVLVELGADPYEKDGLPSTAKLKLTLPQMLERDLLIYDFLQRRGLPQAYLMAGGYGEHAWEPYPPFLQDVLCRRI